MDEVADIGPPVLIAGQVHCGPEAGAQFLHPDLADALDRHLARRPLVMEARLETVEGDLAHHRVQPVLDPARQQGALLVRRRLGQQAIESQALGEDRRRLGQRQRRIGQQAALPRRQRLVHPVAQFMRQRQDVAPLAHPVQEDIRVPIRRHRVSIGAGLLARPRPRIDPRPVEEPARPLGEVSAQISKAGQHHRAPARPVIGARRRRLDRRIAVPVGQPILAHRLGLQRIIAMRQTRIGFGDGLSHGVHALAVDFIAQMAAVGGTFEAAFPVLQRLFGGDGVQHHGHGPGDAGKGLRQALARRLTLGAVRVAETVQPFGQGQLLIPEGRAQRGQGLVEQARPLGLDRAALGDEGLQLG